MKGKSVTRPDRWPAVLLALGFTAASVAMFAAAWAVGAGLLGQWRSHPVVWAAAGVVLAVLLVADLGWFGLRTPMWHRQTPKWFMYKFTNRISALLWGIDAGLVFTTIRVTSLSWAALALTLLGLLPWWTGAVYALAFVIPELFFDLVVPRRTDPTGRTDPEPTWVVGLLLRMRPTLRPIGLAALAGTLVWTVAVAVVGAG